MSSASLVTRSGGILRHLLCQWCKRGLFFTQKEAQRRVGDGRDLWRSSAPTPLLKQGHVEPYGRWAPLTRAWLRLLCILPLGMSRHCYDPPEPSLLQDECTVMHNAIAHCPLSDDAQTDPARWQPRSGQPAQSQSSARPHTVWDMALASLGQLSWLRPLPARGAPAASWLAGRYGQLERP